MDSRGARSLLHRPARAQRGVALVVALILLLIGTIIGLASIRNTNLQERMSANMYDRSLAFQRAEAGLRAAEQAITSNWKIADLGGRDCSPESANLCTVLPPNTYSGTNANWTAVNATYDVNDGKTPGAPEYYIQYMGTGNAENNLGLQANADYANYGNSYPPDNVAFYRITARSSSPADTGDQAIVVLQTTVKRAY